MARLSSGARHKKKKCFIVRRGHAEKTSKDRADTVQRRREASHVPLDPKRQRLVLLGAMPRGLPAGEEVGAGPQRISKISTSLSH